MDTFAFTDKDGKVRKVSTSERAVLAALLRDLHQGCPAIKTKQPRLVDKSGVCLRVVRDALHALNRAGLIVSTIIRNGKKRIIGSHHDLSGILRMLPEKTLKSLHLWDKLTPDLPAKSAAIVQAEANGQEALPLDDNEADCPSQMTSDDAPEGDQNEADDDVTYRQDSPHSVRQKQTLFVKQHITVGIDENEKPLPDPNTDRGVVALLAAAGVEWKRAWKCVRTKKRNLCLEWLAALSYYPKRETPGGFLAAAILDGYKFPAAYLSARDAKQAKNEHRAAAQEPHPQEPQPDTAAALRAEMEAQQNARLDSLPRADYLTLVRESLAGQHRPDAPLGRHLREHLAALTARPDAPIPEVRHFVRVALLATLNARKDC